MNGWGPHVPQPVSRPREVPKGGGADRGECARESELGERGVARERPVGDGGQAEGGGEVELGERGQSLERPASESAECRREHEPLERRAAIEGAVADGGERGGKDELAELRATTELNEPRHETQARISRCIQRMDIYHICEGRDICRRPGEHI